MVMAPIPSPQFGQLGPLLFGRQKQCFARMTETFSDDYNVGCNDNYDDNDGNFLDTDFKNDKKNVKLL